MLHRLQREPCGCGTCRHVPSTPPQLGDRGRTEELQHRATSSRKKKFSHVQVPTQIPECGVNPRPVCDLVLGAGGAFSPQHHAGHLTLSRNSDLVSPPPTVWVTDPALLWRYRGKGSFGGGCWHRGGTDGSGSLLVPQLGASPWGWTEPPAAGPGSGLSEAPPAPNTYSLTGPSVVRSPPLCFQRRSFWSFVADTCFCSFLIIEGIYIIGNLGRTKEFEKENKSHSYSRNQK